MQKQQLLKAARFIVLAAVSFAATGPLVGFLSGVLGKRAMDIVGLWIFAAVLNLLLLAATWVCLRRDGESFASLGLSLDAPRLRELGAGFLVGALLFALIAVVSAFAVGATWQFSGAAGLRTAALGLPIMFLLMLGEELVFRGYAFRQMVAGLGVRRALLLSAVAFGVYHVLGSGSWGMGWVFRFGMPTLGGLVFGLAMIRSGGLALPIGLHLGGNWVQASVFGFGAAGGSPSSALFTAPLTPPQLQVLTAPDLLPHLPYLLALATIAALLVARWPREASLRTRVA